MSTLCVDIGGTKLALAVFEGGGIVDRFVTSTDRAGGREWTLGQIERQAKRWRTAHPLDRCGVGFGGPVDFPQQRVARSMHVAGWSDFPLAEYLQDKLGLPPAIDNDANVGALGEATFGAGKNATPLLYVTISTGIGGGIVLGDGIYRGADSLAGEIGHMPVRPEGPECLCGSRGCFERLCSGLWLQRDHGKPASELLRDPAFVDRYVIDLAAGLRSAIMLLNPARIVIGGGISKAGDALFIPLRREINKQMPASIASRVDVVQATLGDDSVLFGAAVLQAPDHSK